MFFPKFFLQKQLQTKKKSFRTGEAQTQAVYQIAEKG